MVTQLSLKMLPQELSAVSSCYTPSQNGPSSLAPYHSPVFFLSRSLPGGFIDDGARKSFYPQRQGGTFESSGAIWSRNGGRKSRSGANRGGKIEKACEKPWIIVAD